MTASKSVFQSSTVCLLAGLVASSVSLASAQSFEASASNHLDTFVSDMMTNNVGSDVQQTIDLAPTVVPSISDASFTAPIAGLGLQSTAGLLSAGYASNADLSAPLNSILLKPIDAVRAPSDAQLFVVPLPSAAFAGLGMLVGIAGVRTLRRRS